MWRISHETRVLILNCLVNGMSMRGTARVAGVGVNTVARVLREIGVLADRHHEQNVVGVEARRIQIDEMWGFVGAKRKNAPTTKKRYPGDIWTWLAVDPESKLTVSYIIGNRTSREAHALIADVRKRVVGRPHFTSDGLQQYTEAICAVYGNRHPYSRIVYRERSAVLGDPDLSDAGTALVERFNLTMRAHNARYVRRGMTYSKSVEQHVNMCCLSIDRCRVVHSGKGGEPWANINFHSAKIGRELIDRADRLILRGYGLARLRLRPTRHVGLGVCGRRKRTPTAAPAAARSRLHGRPEAMVAVEWPVRSPSTGVRP